MKFDPLPHRVDYFGPFEVKMFRRTVEVGVLFTFGVRAVHLELVDSLTPPLA